MKFFRSDTIPRLDAYTTEHEPISAIDLMERAAAAMTYEIVARWKRDRPMVVFAGPGNNGGDALAVARMLAEEGYPVAAYLFNPLQKLSPGCARNRERLAGVPNAQLTEVNSEFTPPALTEETVVIDGLFGTGLKRPLTGGFGAVAEYINASGATVVALDLPSGLFAEDNSANNRRYIVSADLTLTCQFPKLAFLLAENERFVGTWIALDIGLHPTGLQQTPSEFYHTETADAALLLRKRRRFVSKREAGHLLLVAGSYGMTGAALLAARAAVRAGAGLVSVCAPRCGYTVLQTGVPEALFTTDPANETHLVREPEPAAYQTVAVGPGLGRNPETGEALDRLLSGLKRAAVVDADALNRIAERPELLGRLPKGSVLTPHVREFDRLFGKSDTGYERAMKAQQTARRTGLIVVLKGACTCVALPDGSLHFNGSGNPGMATGGCGDVLTGVIGGLLAQGYPSGEAAVLGVFVHGLAGDLTAEAESEEAVTPTGLTDRLGAAFRRIAEWRDK